jgi:predicted ATPase
LIGPAVRPPFVCSFGDLCSLPLGAADYIAIARHFHTIFLTDIPILDTGTRVNETRRFITLIDTLYENHVKLICTAAAPPHLLLDTTQSGAQEVDLLGTADAVQKNHDEGFAFERTVSRLTEMQTEAYLTQGHKLDE